MSIYAIFDDQRFNDMLSNDIVSFEQLGPDRQVYWAFILIALDEVLTKKYYYRFLFVLRFYGPVNPMGSC